MFSLALQGAFAPGSDGQLPARIKIFNWGVNETKKGPVIVNETTVRELPLNQDAAGFDVISLDYQHTTVPGSEEYKRTKEPRDIAAQLKLDLVPGDGLYVLVLNWTPTGKEKAINFVDLSPAPAVNDKRELVFLHSVALCRQGATEDLHFLTLSVGDEGGIETSTKESAMDPKVLQELISKSVSDALKPLADRLTVLETTGSGAKTTIETLAADMTATKTTVATLTATLAQKDREDLILDAKRAGKVIPLSAEDLKTVDLGMLRKIVAQTPVTVPVTQVTLLNVADPSSGISPALAMVCRVTGREPQKVLEANKAKAKA